MKNTFYAFVFLNLWHAIQNGNDGVFAFSSVSLSSHSFMNTQTSHMMNRRKKSVISSLSMSATTIPKPKGCAARPAMKKKVIEKDIRMNI